MVSVNVSAVAGVLGFILILISNYFIIRNYRKNVEWVYKEGRYRPPRTDGRERFALIYFAFSIPIFSGWLIVSKWFTITNYGYLPMFQGIARLLGSNESGGMFFVIIVTIGALFGVLCGSLIRRAKPSPQSPKFALETLLVYSWLVTFLLTIAMYALAIAPEVTITFSLILGFAASLTTAGIVGLIPKRKEQVSEAEEIPPGEKQGTEANKLSCHNCKAQVQPGDAFCLSCGAKLKDIGSVVDEKQLIYPESYSCPNCNAHVQPEDVFCMSCGVKIK
ncbi:MAG: zinc ribbon domain-containing protein [Candidatus Thermoplasmatota archaeon]